MENFKLDITKIEDAINQKNNSLIEVIIIECERIIKAGGKVEIGREVVGDSNNVTFEKERTYRPISNLEELELFKNNIPKIINELRNLKTDEGFEDFSNKYNLTD